jgi:hypothetical protein
LGEKGDAGWLLMHVLCVSSSSACKPDDDDEAAIVLLSFNLKVSKSQPPPQHLNKPITQAYELKKADA